MSETRVERTLEEIRAAIQLRKIRTWGGVGFSVVALALIPFGVDPNVALSAVSIGLGIGDFSEILGRILR